MVSSRRVSNDVISQPVLSAQLRLAVLWAAVVRADVLFGVEQPNEQQAEVRKIAPTALLSDYHTKTYPCVFTHLSVWLSVYACLTRLILLLGNLPLRIPNTHAHTHTPSDGHFSNEERGIKVKRATVLHSERGEKRKKRKEEKSARWGGMGKRRRDDGRLAQVSLDRPGTSDTLSPRLTLVQQLVLCRALHCLPRHFVSCL